MMKFLKEYNRKVAAAQEGYDSRVTALNEKIDSMQNHHGRVICRVEMENEMLIQRTVDDCRLKCKASLQNMDAKHDMAVKKSEDTF